MEATPEAVDTWRQRMDDLVNATVLPKGKHSWFLGDNIPGKPHVVLFYFGGAGAYRQECQAAADQGFAGFATSKACRSSMPSSKTSIRADWAAWGWVCRLPSRWLTCTGEASPAAARHMTSDSGSSNAAATPRRLCNNRACEVSSR